MQQLKAWFLTRTSKLLFLVPTISQPIKVLKIIKTFLSRPRPRPRPRPRRRPRPRPRPRLYFLSPRRLETKTLVSRTTPLHVSSEWEHRWHRHTATWKDQKLTSVLMNASATSTIASSSHPRNVCDTSDRASTYIEKLRQHLLLPHHRLSVHTSTIWRYHKASNLKAICHASSIPQCKNIYLPDRAFA